MNTELRKCRICGNEKSIDDFQIRRGTPNRYWQCRTCNTRIATLWNKTNSIRRMAISAARRAKLARVIFAIDGEWVLSQLPIFCPCCKNVLRTGNPTGRGKKAEDRPSLDRIDPSIGYTKENTRIICTRCNRIKNSGSVKDHEAIVRWLAIGAPQIVSVGFADGDGI